MNSAKKDNTFSFSNFDKIMEYESKHFWYLLRKEIIYTFIKMYSGEKGKGIELGAGIGQNALYLERKGFRIDCAEYYQEAIDYIRKSGFKGNVSQLNLLDNDQSISTYDFYGLFDVIEHFEKPVPLLNNIFNKVPEGSFVFASVPAYRFLWSKKDDDVGHMNRFTKKELSDVFKMAGFQVVDSTYIFSYLFFPLLVSRLMKVKKQKEYTINALANSLLLIIGRIEVFLLRCRVRFPFGGSVFIVAKK